MRRILDKLSRAPVYSRILAVTGIGALMTLALPPVNIWPFLFIGFSLFYILLHSMPSLKTKTLAGWFFAFGYFGAGLWWIANALLVEGNEFSWVWPLAIVGLPALLAFFTAFACLLTGRFANLATAGGFLIFLASFGLAEWLRGHLFSGFPWNTYAYAWSGWTPMMQSASLFGSYGLNLITMAWAAAGGFLWLWPASRKQKGIFVLILSAGFALNFTYGAVRMAHYTTGFHNDVFVKPVQPSIPQADKWDPSKAWINLEKFLALSAPDDGPAQGTMLVIWPETAISYNLLGNTDAKQAVSDMLSSYEQDVYLITGFLRRDEEDNYFNSLAVFDRRMDLLSTYDKSHLVPFGEYIPFENILKIAPFVRFSGFKSGNGPVTRTLGLLPPFSPLVCYEIIFPGAVKARTGERPQWIVNVTNDSWYGDSPGPYQHFAQSRFRAVEEGLPVVRAANNGISGVIDPLGRPVRASTLDQITAPAINLPRALSKPTFYSNWGDISFMFCLILLCAAGYRLRRPS